MLLWLSVAAASVLVITLIVVFGIALCALFLARIFKLMLANDGKGVSRDIAHP